MLAKSHLIFTRRRIRYCHRVLWVVAYIPQKKPRSFCHSERSEESLFDLAPGNEREIPRFARNDKINRFCEPCLTATQSAETYRVLTLDAPTELRPRKTIRRRSPTSIIHSLASLYPPASSFRSNFSV